MKNPYGHISLLLMEFWANAIPSLAGFKFFLVQSSSGVIVLRTNFVSYRFFVPHKLQTFWHLAQCLAHYIMGSGFIAYGIFMAIILVAGEQWMRQIGRSPEYFDSIIITAWVCVDL